MRTRRGIPEAVASLERFEALYPYVEIIAEVSGLAPFHRKVVEAYWIGNELLEGQWEDPFRDLIARLQARGLPRSFAEDLLRSLPTNPLPHHTFHVLFVGVGSVTGHVPTTLENMERCMISWGRVLELEEDRLRVSSPALEWTGDAFRIGEERPRYVARDGDLLPRVDIGDAVTIHWEAAVDRVDPRRLRALRLYTSKSIEAVNVSLRRRSMEDLESPAVTAPGPGEEV